MGYRDGSVDVYRFFVSGDWTTVYNGATFWLSPIPERQVGPIICLPRAHQSLDLRVLRLLHVILVVVAVHLSQADELTGAAAVGVGHSDVHRAVSGGVCERDVVVILHSYILHH